MNHSSGCGCPQRHVGARALTVHSKTTYGSFDAHLSSYLLCLHPAPFKACSNAYLAPDQRLAWLCCKDICEGIWNPNYDWYLFNNHCVPDTTLSVLICYLI